MRLMSLEVYKQKRRENKNKSSFVSKQLENRLLVELKEKLDEHLLDNDKFMLEVQPRVVGEFLNILSNKSLTMYDFEQLDKNKFIFYNKEIDI